jgi:hypothetical protein
LPVDWKLRLRLCCRTPSRLAARRPNENFRQFSARHTDDELRGLLAGELVVAVTRDVAAERPPQGVDG